MLVVIVSAAVFCAISTFLLLWLYPRYSRPQGDIDDELAIERETCEHELNMQNAQVTLEAPKDHDTQNKSLSKVHTLLKPSRRLALYIGLKYILLCATAIVLYLYDGDADLFAEIKAVALMSILCVAAITDLKSYRIPNLLIIVGIGYWLALSLLELLLFGAALTMMSIISDLVVAIVVGILVFLLSLAVKGVGFGDIKLLFVMCLLLGMQHVWPPLFLTLFGSFAVAAFLLISKKMAKKDMLPFAPFAMAGTGVALLVMGL
jgi:leader peptidase (prepilin peptidase)/N-methyltransferase